MSPWNALKRGINEGLEQFIKDKLRNHLIYKEADLQVWTYLWFYRYYGHYFNLQYFVFNQARFQRESTIPDIVVMHGRNNKVAAIEIKDQLGNPALTIDDILLDTTKCFEYLSQFNLAIQLVVHDFDTIQTQLIDDGIAEIIDNNRLNEHRFLYIIIHARKVFDTLKEYSDWKIELDSISAMFKSVMGTNPTSSR